MRNDLQYVVGEAGRSKGPSHKTRKWSPPHRYALEDDGSPIRVSMRPRKGHARKHTSFRYQPLRRLIQASVGTSWDTIYSDLRQRLRRQTSTTLQALNYISYLVPQNRHLRWTPEFLVDQTTGELTMGPQLPNRRACYEYCMCRTCVICNPITKQEVRAKNFRLIDQTRYAEKEEGIWYTYSIAWHKPDDLLTWELRGNDLLPVRYRDRPNVKRWYIARKCQMNRKMLRRLGIRNDR